MHTVIDLRSHDTHENSQELPALEFNVDQHQVEEIRMKLWQQRNARELDASTKEAA